MDLDGAASLGALEAMQLFHLVRVWHELDDRRQHRLDSHVELTGDAEQREQLHALHRFLHRLHGVVTTDLPSLQIALEERIVRRSDGFDELLVVLVEGRLILGGYVGLLKLARFRSLLIEVVLSRVQFEYALQWGPLPCWASD